MRKPSWIETKPAAQDSPQDRVRSISLENILADVREISRIAERVGRRLEAVSQRLNEIKPQQVFLPFDRR